jgi:hypothetical protein
VSADYKQDIKSKCEMNKPREDQTEGVYGDKMSKTRKNLINLQRITLKEASICRNDISKFDADDVSRDKDGCLFLSPTAIT